MIKIASNIKGKFKRDRVLGDVTNVEGTPASSRSASPESNKRKASVSLAPSISPSASPASKGGIPYSVVRGIITFYAFIGASAHHQTQQPLLQALSGDIKTKKALKKEILLLAERNQAMEGTLISYSFRLVIAEVTLTSEMQVQWTQDLHDAQEDFGRATNTAKATEAELEKVKAELAQIKQRNTALENEVKQLFLC